MPDLIQVANDLKDMPDQYLAQQMQKPDGSVPPWLVASEVARRDRLRSGQAKAQAPASSVSQDLLKSLYAKIPPTAGLAAPPPGGPGGPAPPGMPPVNLTPGQATMGTPPPGATPPSSFKMPSQGMAEGGEVDDGSSDDEESAPPPDIYNLPMLSRRAQMDQLMAPPIPTSATTPQTAPPVMPQAPAAMPGPAGEASRMAPDTGTDIPTLVDGAAKKYQLPPELIMAVIKRESSGRPGAIGPEVKGGQHAIGLMQVLPSTAASEFGIKDPQLLLDPAINVDTGARYLKKLMVMFNNDPQTALAAYYTGPGNVRKYGGAPEYTSGYTSSVLGTANALRAHYGLPQMNQLPGGMTSRLLQPTPPAPAADQPAQQLAAAGPPADSQPPATDDTGTDASGPSDTAAAATPAKEGPLNQVYTPTEPAEITSLKGQIAAKQEGHQSVRDQIRDTYKQDNLDLLSDAAKTLIGPQQDYSKYSGAIQEVMDMAKKNMHPKISDMLIQFGTALMASKEHNFGVAVGHAGQSMLANINAMQEQGTKDYLTAAKAGVDLQDKMDLYQAKVGQYKMARLAAQQTGIVADERTYQTQLTGLQKELDTAQNKFNTSITSPNAQQVMAVALMNQEHIVFDPARYKDPITQLSAMGRTDLVQKSMMAGKPGETPRPAAETETTLAIKAAAGDKNAIKALQLLGKGGDTSSFDAYLNPQGAGATPAAGQPAAVAATPAAGPAATPPQAKATPVTIPPARGTPSLGVSPVQRNEALLANLPPEEAAIVRGLVDYKIALPARTALTKPIWQHRLEAAMMYDPSFNQNFYAERGKTLNNFSNGLEARQVNALNTLIEHVQRLQTNWSALNNWGGWRTPLNAPINWFNEVKGDPRIQPALMDLQAVPEEMMKLWRTAGGSDKDLEGWKKSLGLNLSPESQASSIREVLGLASGKLQGLRSQYENAMGRPADFHFLRPEAAKLFERYGIDHRDIDPGYAVQPGGYGGGAPTQPAGTQGYHIGGREIIPQGGRWVFKDTGQAVPQ